MAGKKNQEDGSRKTRDVAEKKGARSLTERNSLLRVLRESEERYRLLADNTVDGVWLLDMGLKLIYCSPSSEKQSGFTLQEITEMSLDQYFTPESLKMVSEAFLEEVPRVQADPDYNPVLTLDLEYYKKDGTAFWAESKFSIIRDKRGKPVSILAVARDISERKQAEESLRASEIRYRTLFEKMDEGFCIVEMLRDPNGKAVDYRFVEINPAFERHTGLQQALGKTIRQMVPDHDAHWFEIYGEVERTGEAVRFENPAVAMGRYYTVFAFRIGGDGSRRVGILFSDITGRKRAEEQKTFSLKILELLNKEGGTETLISNILLLIKGFSGCEAVGMRLKEGDGYPYYQSTGFIEGHVELENNLCSYDKSGEIIKDFEGNPVLECMCGNIIRGHFDPAQPFFSQGGSFWSNCTTELLAFTTGADRQERTRKRCIEEGYESIALIPLKGEDGNIGLLQLNDTRRNRFTAEIIRFYEGIAQSIGIVLARKSAEGALRDSEEKYRNLFDNASEAIYVAQAGKIVFLNPRTSSMIGYSAEELMARPFIEFIHPDDREMVIDRHVRRLKGEELVPLYDFRIITSDGNTRWAELNTVMITWEGKPATLNFVADITGRKLAEESQEASEAQYHLLSEHTTDTVWLMDMDLNLTYHSPSVQKMRGFTAQEIKEMPLEKHLVPASLKFVAEVLLREISRAEADPAYDPVLTLDLEYYCKDGSTIWLENKLCVIRNASGEPVSILGEGRDISERRLTEEKLEHSYESLKKTFNDAINTMVKIVEMRDPYTAGHQHKVAGLATAIAREMKLEDIRIDQLRMAAVIHDIGKMYIPSDILSRPGRLSDMEFGLIKIHSQSGYDIVKGMDFPCSVAKAVLQHHERLDGSGYPNHLKGDDTLMEAKILAVADVVEAMSSHRPYRPALGIAKALDEISMKKGILFDPGAVDACLELFNSGKFEFKPV